MRKFLASALVLGATSVATIGGLAILPAAYASPEVTAKQAATITRDEVVAAQKAWGEALVKISTTYETAGIEAARKTAQSVIDSAYGYAMGPVLFKPTLAAPPTTFRTTADGALAYFVGGDQRYPGDTGFALKNWRSYKIENAAIFIDGDVAMSMGNVHLTDRDGKVTVVDKTWGYKRDAKGNLRIVLHHSSLPYNPG